MALSVSFPEEKCFNVWWKVKNFSFCSSIITSPEFRVLEIPYIIEIFMQPKDVSCELVCIHSEDPVIKMKIAFVTFDGKEESILCGPKECLQVSKDKFFGKNRRLFLSEDTLTVRIQILTDSEGKELVMCSEIPVQRKYFLWTFKNVSEYQHSEEEGEWSRVIEDSVRFGEITLTLKPVDEFNTGGHYDIEVFRSGGKWCYCKLKVSVLGVDGRTLNCLNNEFDFRSGEDENKVFHSVIKKRNLFLFKDVLLPNDTLSLKCDFAISTGLTTDKMCVTEYMEFKVKESGDLPTRLEEETGSDILSDLKAILNEGLLSDISLHVGSEEIRAHKIMLSARSRLFKSLLEKNVEKNNNSIPIKDLDSETVHDLVRFIHTDVMPPYERENTKKLYLAADRYKIPSLKKKCVSLLKTYLSISNVPETLIFADQNREGDLKSAVLDFIYDYDTFTSTEEWKELESKNSSLACEVMNYVCNKRARLSQNVHF